MSEKTDKEKQPNPTDNPKKTKVIQVPDIVPEKLKMYVSQSVWKSWSPIKRESFMSILNNPNSFFYRNRPPGDPQINGKWTQEEDTQFFNRLDYFRNTLKIEDGLWGLFSVPIRGRLGYQCSNYYRLLIQEGRVQDDRYEIMEDGKLRFKHRAKASKVSKEVLKLLEKEAFEFIEKCINREDGIIPQIIEPVRSELVPQISVGHSKIHKPSEDLINLLGHKRNLCEKRYNPYDELAYFSAGGKGITQKKKKKGDEKSPLFGALDPLTDEPMENPMMDENGFVMDLKSWRRVLKHKITAPCEMVIKSETDLIEMNMKHFNEKHLWITNMNW